MDISAATVPGYAGSPKGGSGVGAANTLQTICLLSALLLTTLPPRPLLAMNQDVLLLLPDSSETVGWHAPDSARVFVGNNLFLLIDGGAPVYLEYGFGQVVAQRYVNEKNERVSLEIYEMIDAGAAYGMFCRQGLRSEGELKLGDGAAVNSDVVSFWKDRFLVTLTAERGDVKESLISMAKAIDRRIPTHGEPPELARLFSIRRLGCSSALYIRGPLGLMNSFTPEVDDLFGVREGIVGHCADGMMFVFSYEDNISSLRWFEEATDALTRHPRFSNVERSAHSARFRDADGNRLRMEAVKRYIILSLAKSNDAADRLLKKLKNVAHSS